MRKFICLCIDSCTYSYHICNYIVVFAYFVLMDLGLDLDTPNDSDNDSDNESNTDRGPSQEGDHDDTLAIATKTCQTVWPQNANRLINGSMVALCKIDVITYMYSMYLYINTLCLSILFYVHVVLFMGRVLDLDTSNDSDHESDGDRKQR